MNDLVTYADNLNAELEAPELDPRHLVLANELLTGKSIQDLAAQFSMSEDLVSSICERPEVKQYVNTVYLTQGYLHRSKRLNIINKVIDSKLEEALETGVYSKRDLLEWMKLLNEMERDSTPKKSVASTAVQINTNNYNALIQDLFGDD